MGVEFALGEGPPFALEEIPWLKVRIKQCLQAIVLGDLKMVMVSVPCGVIQGLPLTAELTPGRSYGIWF